MSKSPDAFRTISEVAEDLGLPQHVLRFWETRFSQIKPMKRGGGRRYYRPDDVEALRGIQRLLYEEGYTIKGVQRIFKSNGNKYVMAAGRGEELATISANPALMSPSQNAAPNGNNSTTNTPLANDTVPDGLPQKEPEKNSPPHRGKKAVTVNQIIENTEQPAKTKGLFNRLVGKEEEPGNNAEALNLSIDDKQLLQSTLYDLLECKRLLDQAR